MNIIVRPYGSGRCYCRPDTTWERENKDFYVPDGISRIYWAPVVFARISKAGKCIGEKFASRYYDSFNFGALIYCVNNPENQMQSIAFTSCIDHTSILPSPLYNPVVMGSEDNLYEVTGKRGLLFRTNTSEVRQLIEEAICSASSYTSLRIGDYVAVELSDVQFLADKADGETSIHATFCSNDLYSLKIIF